MSDDRIHALKACRRMNRARDFSVNTCPASRHTARMAENLAKHGMEDETIKELGAEDGRADMYRLSDDPSTPRPLDLEARKLKATL